MYTKNFFLTVLVVFVLNSVMNYLLHALILPWEIFPVSFWPWEMYPGLINFKDTSAASLLSIFLGNFCFSYFFCLIFARGIKETKIIRGITYGLKMGFFFYFTLFLYNFTRSHYPAILLWGEFIGGIVVSVLMGLVIVIVYKPVIEKEV